MGRVELGEVAPDFQAIDQDGNAHRLSDYRGQWVLLYFYPKDDTPGCTKEACALRDSWERFRELNAVVLGVSTDTAKSHQKFARKYNLVFPLLVDEEKVIVNMYGVWAEKKFMGRTHMGTLRTSFLIDARGVVAKVYSKVKPDIHAVEVLGDLMKLQGSL